MREPKGLIAGLIAPGSRAAAPAILGHVLALVGESRGDTIPHFYGGYAVAANRFFSTQDYTSSTGLAIETGRIEIDGYHGDPYPYQIHSEVEVIGRAHLDANNLFSFMAYSYGEDREAYAAAGAESFVTLGFQDIIRYAGPGSPPPSILLGFHMDGVLSFDEYSVEPNVGQSSVGCGYWFARYGVDTRGYYPGMGNTVPPGSVNYNIGGPTPDDAKLAVDDMITATLEYDDALGGYAFNLNMYAFASVLASERSGAAGADFLHTVSLTGLALGDGGVADIDQFLFDSGLRPTAVPEPSTLAMLTFPALLGLLALRRRMKVSA